MIYTYREPLTIKAIQYTGENLDEVEKFAGKKVRKGNMSEPPAIIFEDFAGTIVASVGDWITYDNIAGFNVCNAGTFELAYKKVN